MSTQSLGAQVVAKVAEDYKRRGYDVDVAPTGSRVPEFLSDFQPDLIARNAHESVVVEVQVGTRTSAAERLRDVAERVNRQPGWRLSLVFVDPEQPDQVFETHPESLSRLRERIEDADTLVRSHQWEAAFLLLWSSLEGILRLLGQRAQLPLESLPPSTLIRELYSAGEISREQFEALMILLPVRNRLVHGFGTQAPVDVESLRHVVQAVLGEVETG